MAKRLKSLAINLLLFGCACLIALFIAEGLVRIVVKPRLDIPPRNFYQIDPDLGYTHTSNYNGRRVRPEFDVKLETNAFGLRGKPIAKEKPPQTLRILLLGDSFAESANADLEASFPYLLEQDLRIDATAKGLRLEVLNAGVGGWGPEHYITYLRKFGLAFQPDIVLVASFQGNDLFEDIRTDFVIEDGYLTRKQQNTSLKSRAVRAINHALKRQSALYVVLKARLENLLWHLGLRPYTLPREILAKDDSAIMKRYIITMSHFSSINKDCRDRDIPWFLVLIPSQYQVEDELLKRYSEVYGFSMDDVDIEKFGRRIGRWTVKESVPVLNLLEPFRRYGKPLYYPMDRHLNPDGHRLTAALMAKFIRNSPSYQHLLMDMAKAPTKKTEPAPAAPE